MTPAAPPIVSVQDVHQSFGAVEVLKGVSMDVPKGGVVCIIGPSGSGKSTLLRCINGLVPINRGSIRVAGFDVPRLKTDKEMIALRKEVSMVFQQYNLFPHKTALQNVMMAPIHVLREDSAKVRERALALLDKVGLAAKADAYPGQLSGGQQQRVAIARSLAMLPEVMLFDEVTAALDPETVKEVLNTIKALAQEGMTCMLVTHEMRFAREIADTVYFTDGGVIVESGPPGELFDRPQKDRTKRVPFANPVAPPRPRHALFHLLARPQRTQRPRELAAGVAKPAPKARYDAVIIGGGGHGLATAYYLAKEHGITNVAVLEKGWLGGGNTGRNTTIVRSNYHLEPNAHFYEFSLKLWEGLSRDLNFNVMYSARGVLNLVHSPADMDAAMRRGNAMRLNGIDAEFMSRDAIARWIPNLDCSADARYPIMGGLMQRAGWHGAPRRRRVGVCARRRCARRGHHPALRSHGHPRSRAAPSPVSKPRRASSRRRR